MVAMWVRILSIGAGGFLGAIARYLLAKGVERYFKGTFPLGTLVVNLIGCFILGFILTVTLRKGVMHPDLRLAITTGFIGAFTTFSTFTYETLALFEGSHNLLALGNVLLSVVLGLALGWLGIMAGKLV